MKLRMRLLMARVLIKIINTSFFGGSRIDVYDNLQIKDKIKLPFLNPTCCYGSRE